MGPQEGFGAMRGSASTPLVATTGDEVLAALRAYDTATRAGDVDGQVAFFSESWRSSSGTTKADLREHLQKQVDRGGDEDKRLVLDDAKVAVEGDSASVDPVALRSPTGGSFFEFKMTRAPDGVWRCDGEWKYVGDLFSHGVEGVSLDEDVSCPDLFKLGGKDVLLCISHRIGCRYYVGEWRDEQFHPESHAQMSWVDNSFFAPESLVDDKGRHIMWAWILDEPLFGARTKYGWSGTLSLPRVLSLGDDGRLRMDVPEEIEALRYGGVRKGPLTVPSGEELAVEGVAGNSLELLIEMESAEASRFGVKVCASPDGEEETKVFYDAEEKLLKVDTRKSGPQDTPKAVEAAPFKLKDGEWLKLRVFVDKSVVEVFANSRQAIARRIYPSRQDSVGVRLFSSGGDAQVHSLEGWRITPSRAY